MSWLFGARSCVLVSCMAGCALVLASAPALGEEDREPASEKPEFRQVIDVTAAHPATPAESEHTSEDIETWASEDLGLLLRRQPGLEAVRRGAIGLDPQVRGLREGQLAAFVDGTRTFAAGPARMDSDVAHVSPRAVKKLRLIKGPYALEWGAGAMAAIYLDTFRGSFGNSLRQVGGRLGLDLGTNGSPFDVYVNVGSGGPRTRWQFLAESRGGDDYEDGDGNEVPGDYASFDVRWSFDHVLNERWQLDYSGGYQGQDDIDYPGRILDATYFNTRSHELSLVGSMRMFEVVDALLYSNNKDHRMNNDAKPSARPMPGRVPPFGLDVDLPTSSDTLGGRVAVEWGQNAVTWSAGVDHYSLDQSAFRDIKRRDNGALLFHDVVWGDVDTRDTGAFVRMTLLGHNWTLGATGRLDVASTQAGETSLFFDEATGGDRQRDDTLPGLAVSARRQISNTWSLVGGAGYVERLPSALERYADRFPSSRFQIAAEFVGDPDLDPEGSLQADFAVDYNGAEWEANVAVFYRRLNDAISVLPDPTLPKRLPLSPDMVFRYVNGGEVTYTGAEAQATWYVGDRSEIVGAVSWLRGEDHELNEPAFGVPPLRMWLTGRTKVGRGVNSELTWIFEDDQDRVSTSRLEQPTEGSVRGDLALSWTGGSWLARLVIENLTDVQYTRHLNSFNPFTRTRVPERGRNLRVAVEYSF